MKKIAIILVTVVVTLAGKSFAQGYNDFKVEYQLRKAAQESQSSKVSIQEYKINAVYDEKTSTLVGSIVRSDNENAKLCSINQKAIVNGEAITFSCGAYQATIAVKRNSNNQIVASGGLSDDHSTSSDLAAVTVKK